MNGKYILLIYEGVGKKTGNGKPVVFLPQYLTIRIMIEFYKTSFTCSSMSQYGQLQINGVQQQQVSQVW